MKKILLLMIFVFFISFATAQMEWDNDLDYSEDDMTVVITNWFGLGEELGTATLTSHDEVDQIKNVMHGKDRVVMWYDFQGWEIYEEGLGDVEFIDLRTNKSLDKSYSFVQAVYNTRIQNINDDECTTSKDVNGSNRLDCATKVIGTKEIREIVEWIPLTRDIPKGNITIGLMTDVGENDYIDGVWTIAGKKVSRHAGWTAGLTNGLMVYWSFDDDDSTTAVDDFRGLINGSYTNAKTQAFSKLGNATYFDGTNDRILWDELTTVPSEVSMNSTFSLNYWFVANTTGGAHFAGTIATCGGDNYNFYTSNKIRIAYDSEYDLSTFQPNTNGTWYMLTIVASGATKDMYINGVANYTFSNSGTWDLECYMENGGGGNSFSMGEEESGGNDWSGYLDEWGIWNRTLTGSEITELYNGGVGITYAIPAVPPVVTSNAPANNTNFSTSSVTMNCSATDNLNLENISLYIDGTINQTFWNISADQTYIDIETTEEFAEGSYLWNCVATDAGTPPAPTVGEERNFTVDLTAPVLGTTWNITTNVFTTKSPINKTFNYSVVDPHLETCWYNSSDNATINVVGCNAHTLNASFSVGGIKQIYYYANDTGNLISYANKSFVYNYVQTSQVTNKPSTLTGSSAQFNLTINLTAIPTTTTTFWYNDTAYSPTTATSSSNQYNSTRTLTIPADVGNNTGDNKTWFWEFKIDGVGTLNTSKEGQNVISVEIGNCSTYGTEIVNWTLHDEGTDARVDVLTHNETEVEIDLTLISITDPSQSWNYFNTWINQSNGTICVPNGVFDTPNELYVDQVTTFRDNGTHVEEFFYLDHRVLNNATVPQIQIYRDLLALDSTSFITSFENNFGLLQKEVVISVLRFYIGEGTYKEVERAITDNNGETVLHLVEEDVVYIFNVTDNDVEVFTSTEFRVFCEDIVSGTTCRIFLDSNPTGGDINPEFGEAETQAYSIDFNRTTRVITLTFTLTESDLMNMTVYPYNWNETDIQSAISTNTTTASSGTMTLVLPASYGNKTFLLEVFKGNEYVTSKTISFLEKLSNYMGKGTALFFAGMVFLLLGLITLNLGSRAVAASAIIASLFVFGIGLVNSSTALVPISLLIILMALIIIYVISQRRGRT